MLQKTLIQNVIALIDIQINRQVNQILHHRQFQALEAGWRGVMLLLDAAAENKQVSLKILCLPYVELRKDLLNAIEFDQSLLFNKIYTAEYDQPGGEPYGLLIGDYYFRHRNQQAMRDGIRVLREIAKIAASAFAPFIAAADASLFGLDDYTDSPCPFNLDAIFQQQEYSAWQALRREENARFVGLALPRILLRQPYNRHARIKARYFTEQACAHTDYLWGNAAYAFGCAAIQAFKQSGWFADTRGYNPITLSGGSITLAREFFSTDVPLSLRKYATEILLNDSQENQFSEHGFMPLRDNPETDQAIFYQVPSLQKPKRYQKDIANQNAQLSTMLHYLLCASRFAHYIKIIMRDKIGSLQNAADCEQLLQNWLLRYCAASNSGASHTKARYPLHQAKVDIKERIGTPGKFHCIIHIKPHYQFDQITSQLRLVTQIKLV